MLDSKGNVQIKLWDIDSEFDEDFEEALYEDDEDYPEDFEDEDADEGLED